LEAALLAVAARVGIGKWVLVDWHQDFDQIIS